MRAESSRFQRACVPLFDFNSPILLVCLYIVISVVRRWSALHMYIRNRCKKFLQIGCWKRLGRLVNIDWLKLKLSRLCARPISHSMLLFSLLSHAGCWLMEKIPKFPLYSLAVLISDKFFSLHSPCAPLSSHF